MKKLSISILLPITILMSSGCSSHHDVVSVSNTHHYDQNFGLVENHVADRQIHEEMLAMHLPKEVDMPSNMNPEWTTELNKDPDAFYADEYVEEPEVITYKYKFDKKFYDHAEWRKFGL
ncbi:MAG: Unknown protein [uncultured Sulfurovum sp.]|uniref:Lipoprotein n=1 Tax=uncultured Sulfurovum sp. TaxID=269237 RepID=A0A6S6SY18_9BACT|nr:MAG: Unknown protein [uncultured Sulfurovum sp.]